jgi:hypothetical protein
MMSRVIERTIYFALAFGLFALAFWPRLRASISYSVLFGGLCVIFIAAGLRQFATASRLADEVSQNMQRASPFRRLWLPAHWYTRDALVWQFRLTSVMAIAMAVMAGYVAFLTYRRGL